MQKSTLKPMGVRSVYPLEFNKNNPSLEGFEEWRAYIRDQVRKNESINIVKSGMIEVVVMTPESLDALLNMESLRLQAISEINKVRPRS